MHNGAVIGSEENKRRTFDVTLKEVAYGDVTWKEVACAPHNVGRSGRKNYRAVVVFEGGAMHGDASDLRSYQAVAI